MLWYFHLIRWHAIAFGHEFKTENRPINIHSYIIYNANANANQTFLFHHAEEEREKEEKPCVMFAVIPVAAATATDVYWIDYLSSIVANK